MEIRKASAFFVFSPAVADLASPETNPERPFVKIRGPYFPDFIENVVAHVGQATRGKSSNPGSLVINSPFHKSKEQRGQSPCIAKNVPSTLVQTIDFLSPNSQALMVPSAGSVTPVISCPFPSFKELIGSCDLPFFFFALTPSSFNARFKFPPRPRAIMITEYVVVVVVVVTWLLVIMKLEVWKAYVDITPVNNSVAATKSIIVLNGEDFIVVVILASKL
mmetsp:Transcript_28824/g.32310  ORF Transcript_28824/g.32310 Transcript_28824/m.32310 type:complete len:220 (-) Transcript_28824:6-665(-)